MHIVHAEHGNDAEHGHAHVIVAAVVVVAVLVWRRRGHLVSSSERAGGSGGPGVRLAPQRGRLRLDPS
eukprot:1630242-Lingulodinium_polyedra.AAC.1